MCRRVDCPRCGRPTFAGCGLHIEQVLGDVPTADRCPGHEQEAQGKDSGGDDKPSGSVLATLAPRRAWRGPDLRLSSRRRGAGDREALPPASAAVPSPRSAGERGRVRGLLTRRTGIAYSRTRAASSLKTALPA